MINSFVIFLINIAFIRPECTLLSPFHPADNLGPLFLARIINHIHYTVVSEIT